MKAKRCSNRFLNGLIVLLAVFGIAWAAWGGDQAAPADMSVEAAIVARRSIRRFKPDALPRETALRLLTAAQGITEPERGLRAAPSAGATYPLELYLIDASGVHHFQPEPKTLEPINRDDRRQALARAALGQQMIAEAPLTIAICAVPSRTAARYGRERAQRYVLIETGHAAQNIHLLATALGLGSVPVGAFRDQAVTRSLGIPPEHEPIYLIPVGIPRRDD